MDVQVASSRLQVWLPKCRQRVAEFPSATIGTCRAPASATHKLASNQRTIEQHNDRARTGNRTCRAVLHCSGACRSCFTAGDASKAGQLTGAAAQAEQAA